MSRTSQEVIIPVPWGAVAGKCWGNAFELPVLLIHGIQDNSGSFDSIVKLLPKGFYYVCIDLPGHGRSSHFPTGLPLDFFNYVYSIKLIADHLEWSQFTILGHSLGAQISVFFSALYPEKINKVILIDGFAPLVRSETRTASYVREYFDLLDNLNKVLKLNNPPSYTYDEALNRLIKNRPSSITKDSAKILIQRTLVSSGDGCRFSTDQRLKFGVRPLLTMEQLKNIVVKVKCPCLIVVAKDTYDLLDPSAGDLYHERFKLFMKMPNLSFALVEGNHNVHIDYPQRLVAFVHDFLLKPPKSNL